MQFETLFHARWRNIATELANLTEAKIFSIEVKPHYIQITARVLRNNYDYEPEISKSE